MKRYVLFAMLFALCAGVVSPASARAGDASADLTREARVRLDEGLSLLEKGDEDGALAVYDGLIEKLQENFKPELRKWLVEAMAMRQLTRPSPNVDVLPGRAATAREDIVNLEIMIERLEELGRPSVPARVAELTLMEAQSCLFLDELDLAFDVYGDVLRKFANRSEPELRRNMMRAWCMRHWIMRNHRQGKPRVAGKGALKALAGYNRVLNATPAGDDGQAGEAARALYDKAMLFYQSSAKFAAFPLFEELERLHGGSGDAAVAELVARGMLVDANFSVQMEQFVAGAKIYRRIVDRFGDRGEAGIREQTALAALNLGVLAVLGGDASAAIAAYDGVIDRCSGDAVPFIRNQAAFARLGKGMLIGLAGDSLDAVRLYDEVEACLGDGAGPIVREGVQLGRIMLEPGQPGRTPAVLREYDQTIDCLSASGDPADLLPYVEAMYGRALVLGGLGDSGAMLAALDGIVGRFSGVDIPEIAMVVVKALNSKAAALHNAGDKAGALAVYDETVRLFASRSGPALREAASNAMALKMTALFDGGDGEAAIRVCGELVAAYGDAPEPVIRRRVAGAMMYRGMISARGGDRTAAIRSNEEFLAKFRDDPDPEIVPMVKLIEDLNRKLAQ